MKIILILVFGWFSVLAQAQEDATGTSATSVQDVTTGVEQAPPEQEKELQKIEITGSYIKRLDEEAPNPVQTITKEQLKKSGYNSVSDVMRDNAVTSGGQRESSLNGNPGVATTGIGAFNSDSILVLLDGNRLPKIGGANSVDLNLIPMEAIERVEILKDGASATYGSDAVGGVINFITKKDYDGASISLGNSLAEAGGAGRVDFAGAFGKKFSGGSMNGIVQYRHNDPLADADRPFTRVSDIFIQGSPTSEHAQWLDADGVNQAPGCPEERIADDGTCMFDYTKYSWNLPRINQYSTLLGGTVNLGAGIKSKTNGVFTYRSVGTRLAPAPGRIHVSQDVAQNQLGLTNIDPDGTNIRVRLLDGGGTRDSTDTTFGYAATQGFTGPIAGSWTWDVTGNLGRSRTRQNSQGYADTRILQQLVDSGQWNPTLGTGQKGDLSPALIKPYAVTLSTQSEVRAIATGQVFDFMSLAVGASTNWQEYEEEVDEVTRTDNSFGGNGANGQGKRDYQAVFQELNILPIESVEVGLAARYDKYSDFGETFNPKLSLSWQATDAIMFRTSVGTGFRAPNLSDLYAGGSLGFPSFRDPIGCANSGGTGTGCNNRQHEVATFNDPTLSQETSIFYNVGILAQPKKNWNVEANMFIAKVEDSVGGLDGDDMMRAAELMGEDVLRAKYKINIIRDSAGQIERVEMPSAFNIASSTTQGVDFRISNESKANVAGLPIDLIFDVTHIQFLRESEEAFPGLGLERNKDVNFKNYASVTGAVRDHSLTFTARTISGGDKAQNIGTTNDFGYGSTRTHTEFDLNYGIAKIFKKAHLNIGVKNAFDTDRPLDDTAQQALNTDIYDPIGRYYYTNVSYTF